MNTENTRTRSSKASPKATRTAPTLDDVAKAAGVSTATVSRCLNSPDRVVEKTRTRVMKAVEELGYTPHFGARMMAANRTYTIGAIIPTMENAIFARGIQAFQEALHARGYTLLVSSSAYRPEVEEEQVRALVARGADGLLLIGFDRDPAIYRFLEQRKVPVLTAWAYAEGRTPPTVGFDNRAAMNALTQKVLDLGHRDIAVISGITDDNDRAAERIAGINAACANADIAKDALRVIETPYGIEEGARAFAQLMAAPNRPSVVMCGNDVLAAGALRQAREMGLNVPTDVSITGFDDIELARIVTPTLTTVHVPHREMGQKAALALIGMVETGDIASSEEVHSALVLRESLGPPTR